VNYRVKDQITMADLSFRAQHVIKPKSMLFAPQLSRNGIEVLTGVASFSDPTHIHVVSSKNQSDYEAANVIIGTGTKPAESTLVPFNNRNIINSDQILSMPEIPKTLSWWARSNRGRIHMYVRDAGRALTLIEKRPRLLEFADSEMVEALCYHLRDRRVTMRLNEEVESVEETPDNGVAAVLKSKKKVSGDALLYAVGRQGNVDELNLAAAGWRPTRADALPSTTITAPSSRTSSRSATSSDFPAWLGLHGASRIAAATLSAFPSIQSRNYLMAFTPFRNFFYRKTEEQLTEEAFPMKWASHFSGNRARPDSRRHHWASKVDFRSRFQRIARSAHCRRRCVELLHIDKLFLRFKGTVEYFATPSSTTRRWRNATKPPPSTVLTN